MKPTALKLRFLAYYME